MSSILGIFLAGITSILKSSSEIVSKFTLLQEIDEYVVSWALRFFALPVLILGVLIYGTPSISNDFWLALFFTIPSGVLATLLYMKAIQASDLSLISPLAGISPVLVLLSSPFIIGEFPSVFGLIGVMTTSVGVYILKIDKASTGFLSPFKAILTDRGAQYMLGMLILYSITSPIDKIGVEASSPIFYTFMLHIGQILILTPLMMYFSDDWKLVLTNDQGKILSIGLLSGLSSIVQMTAISLTLVVYVISIKRAGIILSVLAGHFLFNEEEFKERILGTLVILSGLILIAVTESHLL